ncbi:MAG: response regulator [Deltaproteobacteria bacterium]|nr:response regulator [Deltaproteobacteria bacterium]
MESTGKVDLGPRIKLTYVISTISFALYIVLAITLRPFIGIQTTAMFQMIPVFVVAGLMGMKSGIVSVCIVVPLNSILLYSATGSWIPESFPPSAIVGHLGILTIALAIGRIHDVTWMLRLELQKHQRTQEELGTYRDNLENLVRERTTELDVANEDILFQAARQERTEQAMVEQGKRLEAVLQSIGDGVLAIDTEYHIVLTNPKAKEHLSILAQGALDGEVLTELGGMPMKKILKEPAREAACHEISTSSPEQKSFEVIAHPIETERRIDGWVLVMRDVSQAREIRNRSASQERLAAVGQLAAGIAHDFNNTLFGIMGYAQLLTRAPEMSRESIDRLEKIYEGGEHAAKMIQQILDFGRKSPSRHKTISLSSMCQNAMELIHRTLPENIEKSLTVEPGDYLALANSTQLQQMLTNLAVNARDAMPNGGEFRVRLSYLTVAKNAKRPFVDMSSGEWIVMEVSDTGEGISQDALPRIFEPFFTTKPPTEGTGLGLAQVYGIVKQHGGFVDVRTQSGRGTSFIIYFPALEAATSRSSSAPPPAQFSGQGETILLVDDDKIVLESGKEMLESLGYQALTARNGREAIEKYDRLKEEISLIITDFIMPEMGGDALLRALKKRGSTIKVIVLSGYPLEQNGNETFENVVATAAKPLHMSDLGALIQDALKE